MASSVFEGTSLVNMYVKDCWVNGNPAARRQPAAARRRTFLPRSAREWSDPGNVLYLAPQLLRDLGRLLPAAGRVLPGGPQGPWAQSPLREGLVKIREASDIELKLNEVERLLKNAINLPWKFSRSEVMLTFFERSPLDQVLRNDKVHRIQPCFQSPLNISEIMRSNGFCLANTETIVFDERLSPPDKDRPSSTDSEEHTYDDGVFLPPEPEPCDEEPEAYVTNLSYYHLVPFETDILE
ncbi:hypothetical protein CRUP_000063 [Coryphaenoides rupestris]|nr:hypothetical protein CRUP_000063 [Coryphaenoides rupestris]